MFKSYIIEYMNYDVCHTNECGKNKRFIYQFQSLKFNARLREKDYKQFLK